ncbi:hypothetical protein [Streptomyces griseorubiginosus]|uniref:hypothetical protein n=1 Tax=Streptomyces griseorubiginosus TaxID=67304 RepID=UPI0036E86AD9
MVLGAADYGDAAGVGLDLDAAVVPTVLGDATIRAIVDRPVAGWEKAQPEIEAMEAERGLTAGRRYKVAEMARHALREAERVERLPEAISGTRSA